MIAALNWPIFAKVPGNLRDRMSSFYVFGRNGDKLIFFTRSAVKVAPVPNNSPNPEGNPDVVPANTTSNVSDEAINNGKFDFGDEQSEAFSVGKNSAGCLATGDVTAVVDSCHRIEALCSRRVIDLVVGERYHVLLLTSEGEVFAWGDNKYGQVANGNFDERVTLPSLVLGPQYFDPAQKVVQISVGCSHSVCLTDIGRVYSWGTNETGQLGDGSKLNRVNPIRVEGMLENARVTQIGCCQKTSIAIDDKGKVYQWGNMWNENGVGLGAPATRPIELNATYPAFSVEF